MCRELASEKVFLGRSLAHITVLWPTFTAQNFDNRFETFPTTYRTSFQHVRLLNYSTAKSPINYRPAGWPAGRENGKVPIATARRGIKSHYSVVEIVARLSQRRRTAHVHTARYVDEIYDRQRIVTVYNVHVYGRACMLYKAVD
jgi:hypothetical protein